MSLTTSRVAVSPGEKRLYLGCLILLFGIAGMALWSKAREATPTIAFPTPRPTPNPNGYDLYLQAAQTITPSAVTRAVITVDQVDDAAPPRTAQQRAQRYSLARRRAWLNSNAKGFALFQQALKTPCIYPDPLHATQNSPVWATLRQLSRNQVKRANTAKMEGHWGDAAQVALDGMQMGSDTARGGSLLPRLVGMANVAIARIPFDQPDNFPAHLNAREARAAATRLESIVANLPPYSEAIKADRWRALAAFLQAAKKSDWRSLGDKNLENQEATWQQKSTSRFIFKREIVRRINAHYNGVLAEIDLPYSTPSRLDANQDLITEKFVLYTSRLRWAKAREQTQLNLILLRFALRAYQVEHKAFPTSLNQLVPSYLKRIPTDTFAANKPLRYVNTGRSYKLWSVGPDGINNGGKPVPPRPSSQPGVAPGLGWVVKDSKGDWVAGLNR